MATYKNYWLERYKANATDWPELVRRPLFDSEGKWTFGGPQKLESELVNSIMLMMYEAPGELVEICIKRAKDVAVEIDRLDLLNTNPRHARLKSSKISYMRGRALLSIVEGEQPKPETWHELALLKLQLFDDLKREGTPAPYEKLHAALYFLLAHECAEAKKVIDGMRGARGYEMEFDVLKKLTDEMVQQSGKVQSAEVCAQVIDYFDQIRDPENTKKFDKGYLDMFEWALLIAETIDPGDGYLDAKRALDMVSR